ncbi:hypothetical protein EB796_021338 [Bugula neritina]|uniref:Uncharacterized protein n=1 Tax=Bugula neritina TaxID=10212 RepID=A0A7J7J3Z2_BUGNE|nr:hypothetical protein EB796_021338 [Bugula neritina]
MLLRKGKHSRRQPFTSHNRFYVLIQQVILLLCRKHLIIIPARSQFAPLLHSCPLNAHQVSFQHVDLDFMVYSPNCLAEQMSSDALHCSECTALRQV